MVKSSNASGPQFKCKNEVYTLSSGPQEKDEGALVGKNVIFIVKY